MVTGKNIKRVVVSSLRENLLALLTLAGVLVGLALGIGLKNSRDEPWSRREAMYVKFIGTIFLNMLKCVIIPLIIPSLISAIGSMDLSLSGRVGLRAIVYYLSTTVLAVVLGIVLVVSIQPGTGSTVEQASAAPAEKRNVTTADTMMDLLRNCFPPNIMQAALQQYKTVLKYPGEGENMTDPDTGAPLLPNVKETWKFGKEWSGNTNILGLVVFSVVTGIAIAVSGEEGRPLLKFFHSVSVVMMRVTGWIIHLAPVGVCFLVAGQLLEMQDIAGEIEKLGWYFLTVLLGLSLHGLLVLPAIYSLVTRSRPDKFLANMAGPLVTAFGTASSAATLPVTMDALERKNNVDPRISRFVLPIGATINMDGTALYEAVAALFIAQSNGVSPDIGQVIAISITATAASIGAAGIPQAGLVTMVMVLDTVGLPSESISLILSIDWLLDRFRTAINVLGDSLGAGIVAHLSRGELDMDREQPQHGTELTLQGEKPELNQNGNTNFALTVEEPKS